MSTSPSSATSPSISKGCFDKSAYYSSLPWFRRLLATLNWRPVVDYELREIEFEKRRIEHEQRMQQLKSEIERLDELNSKIDALLFSSSTNSTPPQNTPGNSAG
jgi:hypothetical protein